MQQSLFLYLFLTLSILGVSVLQAQSSKENADFKLALNLYNDKLYDLAAEQLKQFIVSFPNTSQGIEAKFYLGLAQMKLRRYDDARLTFQTFALTYQDNPRAPEAWWNVGDSYVAVGNSREAALAYERVKVFHPRSKLAADALVEASKYFLMAGEMEDARRVLRIVLQEYGSSNAALDARAGLGKIYFQEGKLDLAQTELRRVIEGDPSPEAKAQSLLILGNIYEALGKWDRAEQNYLDITKEYKTSSALHGAYVSLGNLKSTLGSYQEAVAHYKKALESSAKLDSSLLQQALIGAGDAYGALGDYSSAAAMYEQYTAAFGKRNDVGDVLWKSALANAKAKRYSKSDQACNRILRSSTQDILKRRAQIKLAVNASEQKNFAQAVQYYAQFLDQFPDDQKTDEIIFRIGATQERSLNDPRKAIVYYEQLQTRFPRSSLVAEALAGSARCYERSKEHDRAMNAYREIIQKYPASRFRNEAEEHLKKIEVFEAKDKDASLEKLALLVGDVLTSSDKASVSYRLGEIYFEDLKNYEAAAIQFQNAMKNGIAEKQKATALFNISRAYEYLSWREESLIPQAVHAYREFLQQYPSEARSENAALSLFVLNATSINAARQAYVATLSLYPKFFRRDTLLLIVADLHRAAGAKDSAVATCQTIVREFASSPSAEAALSMAVQLYDELGVKDSVLAMGKRYRKLYPQGRSIAVSLELLSRAAIATKRYSEAIECLESLKNKYPYYASNVQSEIDLATAMIAAGSIRDAIQLLTELLDQEDRDPTREEGSDPKLLLALGVAHRTAGNSAEAKQYLTAFLTHKRTGPEAGQAYYELGTMYRAEGSTDLATAYFRQASAAAPTSIASSDVAAMLFESGEYADAIKQYLHLIQADSAEARRGFEARVIIARLRNNELGAADKDIASFSRKYEPTDEETSSFELERGTYFFRKADYTNAKKSFEKVESKYDETASAPEAMYWLGKIAEVLNKPQEAIKIFQNLQESYPKSKIMQRVHLSLGNIYFNAEKLDDAIKNYTAIVDNPDAKKDILPFAMSNLINAYEVAGANDAALSLTRRYIDSYPNNEDTFDKRIKIGILYQRLGYNEQSVLHLQSLLDEAGSDLEGELRYYIGEGYYNKGDFQQAILEFLKVPYLVTKKGKVDWTANALYMSGQSYEKMGRLDQALTMYKQILERSGIDETFKTAARKEIDRVQLVLKKSN